MRKKQIGPEIKLFELDTLKYITEDNIRDCIHYIGIYPERMSPADITFARKSGLLDSSSSKFHLSKIALHYILGVISYSEYAFLMLSKQWIKTTNVGNNPTVYHESLLACILDEIQMKGKMNKSTFVAEMDNVFLSRYAPIELSNRESLRYVRGLLLSTELVIVENNDLIINPLASALVHDFIINKNKINPPSQEEEESYWNSMSNGVFDLISLQNKNIYSSFYPNLV